MLQSSSSVTPPRRAPVLETLEPRRLFAGGIISALRAQLAHDDSAGAVLASVAGATPAAAAPMVTAARLSAGGPTAAFLDAFVAADVSLPNVGHGVDPATITKDTVKIYRTSAGPTRPIPANLGTSGGGDAIVVQPTGMLTAFATYVFEVTSGLKDTSGASFAPFKFTFKTGNRTSAGPTTGSFTKTALPTTAGQMWTALTFGPDGKLYGGTLDGAIYRFTLDASGGLGAGELIDTIRANNGGNRIIGGIEFDPASTANDLILWVSHSVFTLEEAPDWTGKISRLSGANLETYQDKVVGLPRSIRDHVTSQIKFGPDGALYVLQGSMTAMGGGDNTWGFREEHRLSAAMLRVNTKAIGATAVNVQTEDGGTYDPAAPGAPVTLYATGLRNAWDMAWHRNGKLYVPTNGSAAGGSTPGGGGGHALTNVRDTQPDFLFDVVKGGYYGHPNPTRGEYVFHGGNPTSARDPFEFRAYPVGTQPEPHYKGAAFNFGTNYSVNGIIEYKATSFGGTFDGKLMVVRFSGGDDILVLEPDANGNIVSTQRGVPGLTGFDDPLDLIQDPNTGNVYVAEFGGQKITLIKPTAQLGFDKEVVVFNDVNGGRDSGTQYVTFNNRSKRAITIPADGYSLAGKFARMFTITEKPLEAVTLAPGETFRVGVAFRAPASTSAGIKWALLRLKTSDASRPPMDIPLRGTAMPGSGAGEPSLQRILDAYQIGVKVGDANVADPVLATPVSPHDQIAAQQFYKADVKEYVSIQPLAFFGAGSRKSAARVGWYNVVDRGLDTELFSVASTSIQSVNPNYGAGAMFRFDPGDVGFGFYTQFPAFGNRGVYTEHKYNRWEPDASKRQKTRVYVYRTSEGVVVSDTYILAVEDTTGAADFQDAVFILRNVRLSPPTGGGTLPAGPFGIRGLNLIDADIDATIGRIGNGTILDLSDGPFSVQAIVTGTVGSVRFKIDGLQFNTENFGPLTLAGETGNDINPWVPTVGTHTLEARTYSGPNGTGSAGGFKRVTFTVVA